MQRFALTACLVVAVVACESRPDRRSPLPQPTPIAVPPEPPPPPSPGPPSGFQVIQFGEKISDSIVDEERRYTVAAPAAGRVVVRLEWDDAAGGAVTLRLELNGKEIDWNCGENSPWPVEGRVEAEAGEHVRIVVKRGPGCWDYSVAPLASEPLAFTVWAAMEE